MLGTKDLEKKFHDHGFADFRWIDPRRIVVSQWVRMKCQFGCGEFGHTAVDVYATVRKIGYPIQVLARTDQTMNRYAFLLVD
jgi:predicted metal-binding protein